MKKTAILNILFLLIIFLTSCGNNNTSLLSSSISSESAISLYIHSETSMEAISSSVVSETVSKTESKSIVSSTKATSKSQSTTSKIASAISSSVSSLKADENTQRVTITIKALDKVLLADYVYNLEGKKSVFDVLKAACSANGLTLKYDGALGMYYVTSINGFAEKKNGINSGWIYKVNGEKPSLDCGKYIVKNGDILEWIYSKDAFQA